MLDKMEAVLGSYISARGNEVRFCCPFCHERGKDEDTKNHLYFNRKSGYFFCHRCEKKGHANWLTKGFASHSAERKPSRMDLLAESLRLDWDWQEAEEETVGEPVGLPDDYAPLFKYPTSQAVNYLEGRGIPFDLAVQRGLGFGTKMRKGRIIFPVYSMDLVNCVYWVARSYANLDHLQGCDCFLCKRRYTNAEASRGYYLYGMEFTEGREVCLTEGPVSCLSSGPNAVASFGKYVTDAQIELLCDNFDLIQVAIDPDALDRAVELMTTLLGRRKHVEYVRLPDGKDPNDVGIDGMLHLRETALPVTRSTLGMVLLNGIF